MSEMGGILEFCLVAMFALSLIVLEWQGRRSIASAPSARLRRRTNSSADQCSLPARHPERQHGLDDRHPEPVER